MSNILATKRSGRIRTAWGNAVKKKLLDKNILQKDIVESLNKLGYEISKAEFSNLLYGIGVDKRKDIISKTEILLDITTV